MLLASFSGIFFVAICVFNIYWKDFMALIPLKGMAGLIVFSKIM